MPYPTPHHEKLKALLDNAKLPAGDKPRIKIAIEKYEQWKASMAAAVEGELEPDALLKTLVRELNSYKLYIDVDLIFDSPDDFLYRQKGQLKLDNSVIEEFLPWLCNEVLMPGVTGKGVTVGPVSAYSGVFFESSLTQPMTGGGLRVRTKNQDFAISRALWIKTSHSSDFRDSAEAATSLAYVATEIKTNLDKTMFQEATGTARDVKMAISGAKYFLVCDWLDMTPISTKNTPIDEILVLRKQKRIQATIRNTYDTYIGRQEGRAWYRQYLVDNPYAVDVFQRFVDHVRLLLSEDEVDEASVLKQGYF